MNKADIFEAVHKRLNIHPNERFYKNSRINQIIDATINVCEEMWKNGK